MLNKLPLFPTRHSFVGGAQGRHHPRYRRSWVAPARGKIGLSGADDCRARLSRPNTRASLGAAACHASSLIQTATMTRMTIVTIWQEGASHERREYLDCC
jgi:hypothetical protein